MKTTYFKTVMTIIFFYWHIAATGFFGWNFTAKSAEEIIVDGMFLLGLTILWKGN